MRAIVRLALAGALQFCVCVTANAANAPAAGPQAGAPQIRAAHSETAAATRLIFDQQSGEAATSISVVIADEFLHLVDGNSETIYDFKLRRMIALDTAARRFSNTSLYAAVAFRAFERRNRSMLNASPAVGKTVSAMET